LKIKNWEKFQHYKHRSPPWIKLHVSTLNDIGFMSLSDSNKGILVQLWILASENGGELPDDHTELCFRLRKTSVDLKPFIDSGLIIDASTLQADASKPQADADTEKSRVETEESIGDTPEEPKPYRAFGKLSITEVQMLKLKKDFNLSVAEVDDLLDRIENYAGNKKYNSLYLTARNWARKDNLYNKDGSRADEKTVQDMFTVENPEACRKAMIDAEQQIERDRQTQDNSGRDKLRADLARHLNGELQETADDNTDTVAATG